MAEAKVVKFCTQGDYIKSCQMDDKSTQQGHSYSHMTHLSSCAPGLQTVQIEIVDLISVSNVAIDGVLSQNFVTIFQTLTG